MEAWEKALDELVCMAVGEGGTDHYLVEARNFLAEQRAKVIRAAFLSKETCVTPKKLGPLPPKLAKFTEDYAELDRTDLLHMLLLEQGVCTTLRKMLYEVYDSEFSRTQKEVDKMISEELEKEN